ncbi:GntR family transcriptional regulator [Ktedonosporobacter rubrisoli]|uniref:GntR family transcriptional regulator n=1 Tax=Ktedonosporobacter rubrisoli TaxID=2509675 RepID=UPI0013EE8414|nr:GntR family transcriptional regulator [Ktedonosporobacter rubrisoli]
MDEKDIIRHNSPIPYYYQLARHIEQKIKSKQWLPGEILPSEQEICQGLKISRTVVRQAMNYLVDAELVLKQNGKRSCVAGPALLKKAAPTLYKSSADLCAQEEAPPLKVLELAIVAASAPVAEALNMTEGEQVIKVERLRFLGEVPASLLISYIPEYLCPNLIHEDFSRQSLCALLTRKYQLVRAESLRTVEILEATQPQARLLGIDIGSPLLALRDIGILKNGVPFNYQVAFYRGEYSKLEMHLLYPR